MMGATCVDPERDRDGISLECTLALLREFESDIRKERCHPDGIAALRAFGRALAEKAERGDLRREA